MLGLVLLTFAQIDSRLSKNSYDGLDSMMKAINCNSCQNQRANYLIRTDNIIVLRLQATSLAKHLCTDKVMLEQAMRSNEPTHRVAAAFAVGMSGKADEVLMEMLEDPDALVSQAAREALIHIAKIHYSKPVDFGPYPHSDISQKTDSHAMWRLFFQNTKKTPKSTEEKTKPVSPKEKSEPTSEVKQTYFAPVKKVTVESIDDSIPGMKIKRIETKLVPDLSN